MFSCDVCGKVLSSKYTATVHLEIHTEVKPFACDVCNKSFRRKQHLIRHKAIHTGDKPFSCFICNRKLSSKDGLRQHELQHIDEKKKKSVKNGKKFSQSSHLNQHELLHTGTKSFSCEMCKKGFITKQGLLGHMKNYSCVPCNKIFYCKDSFQMHSIKHTRRKRYSCKVCCTKFPSISDFNDHIISHSKSIYRCEICNKQISFKYQLLEPKFDHIRNTFNNGEVLFAYSNEYLDHIKIHETRTENIEESDKIESSRSRPDDNTVIKNDLDELEFFFHTNDRLCEKEPSTSNYSAETVGVNLETKQVDPNNKNKENYSRGIIVKNKGTGMYSFFC